jgi:putative peptidoglycan lipid II flippase
MTTGRLARAATVVALFGLLSRVLGFARELVLSGVYGTTASTDAFVIGLFVVNTVAAVLLYTLVTLVIPVFQQERARAGERSAWSLLSAIGAWTGIVLAALAAVAAIWPQAAVAPFSPDPEVAVIAERLVRIMAPALMLQGFSALFTALLQVHGRFAGPAAVGVAFNLGIIVGIAIGHNAIGIEAAAWGVTVGALLQIVLQLPQFVRVMRGSDARLGLSHPGLTGVLALAVPVLGASVLQQVNGFTDKLFAATLEEGRVAALNFANALGSAPRTALLFPLLTPLFPLVASMMAERREDAALAAFRRAAGILALVSIPLSIFMALYATEITQLAFKRGQFTQESVNETAGPLVWYALAVWGNFLGYLLNRSLSAANRARDIMVATVVTVALTIGLDLAFLGPLEQSGLALASAIAVYANTAITLLYLRRHLPGLSLRRLGAQQGRLLVCGGIGAAVAALLNLPLPSEGRAFWATLALVAVKVGAGVAAYLMAVRILAPAELADGRRSLRSLLPGRRGR